MDMNGSEYWHSKDGLLHRIDGPALINKRGKFWYLHGSRHREDGPAVEYSNGSRFWYLDNYQYRNEEEFLEEIQARKI